MTTRSLTRLEIWHKDFNLGYRHNLEELPAGKAVFGVFAIVDDLPVNCRYAAETGNLRDSVGKLYEQPEGEGLQKFMQGPWIQMLVYEFLPDSSGQERRAVLDEWIRTYRPAIDEEGEYPGYY
jgi:hypothetical protein